jgi:hypothetical protein
MKKGRGEGERDVVRTFSAAIQPDALAAVVVAHDVLVHSAVAQVHFVSPLDVARRAREGKVPPPPAWMRSDPTYERCAFGVSETTRLPDA